MAKDPRQMTFFAPKGEWVAPTEYPDLSSYRTIAVDLETRDPHLRDRGSGWPRNDGYIIGVAVAVSNEAWYFPIRHEIGPNLDVKRTLGWLAELLSDSNREVVFHNAQYDVGWLLAEGVQIKAAIRDTMIVAPLLDENRFSYSLNNLSRDYLADIKSEKGLREAAAEFGVDAKSEMYKIPASFVGAYAEQDAALTLRLWDHFQTLIVKEDIADILALENKVLSTVIPMRQRGVPVDISRAEELKGYFHKKEKEFLKEIKRETGKHVEIWAAASIAEAFDAIDLPYPHTEKTNAPSFTKFWLKNHEHKVPKMIVEARELNKARTTFVDTILKHTHNGRIHAELNQLRSDDAGTVTGRFSYSNPNLQQMPARNAEIGPLIRSLFVPEKDTLWGAFDYSSQEPRLVVHYGSILGFNGARDFADEYNKDVTTDFHQMAADIVGVPRKQAKDINLGLFYGMGTKRLAMGLGLEIEEGKKLFEEYHAKVPFVSQISEYAMKRAATKGVIRTLLGRRCRFDRWEPTRYGLYKSLSYQEAYDEHGPSIRRAFTYKALNKLIQGSAADQTKAAMVALHENGYLPMIQVHDELDVSVSSEKEAKEIKEIMETCVKLEVPSLVDAEFGKNWGEAKQTFGDKPWTRGIAGNHSEMET
jgi:DNA polymerase I-like protein with 3'-5' exonuclease and polymerase domains|tara:strand:+ start:12849 stop:14783 length:1935 start_codon:yes stop_codon:yes gene_type:complete